MTDASELCERLRTTLSSTKVEEELIGKVVERAYQSWIFKTIVPTVLAFDPTLSIKSEPDGGGIKPVPILGTTYWPDIAVFGENGDPLLAVEVKCVNRKNKASHFSQPIGQAMMYRLMYPRCLVALVLVQQPTSQYDLPPELIGQLQTQGIEVVVIHAYVGSETTVAR